MDIDNKPQNLKTMALKVFKKFPPFIFHKKLMDFVPICHNRLLYEI